MASVPIGLISVMPQAWRTCTPMSTNALIIERGIAEPPHTTMRKCGSFRLLAAIWLSSISHTVGTPAVCVTFSVSNSSNTDAPSSFAPGSTSLVPIDGRRERDAPAIGMEQRNHRQHRIAGIGAERIAGIGHQRVQHVGAMRIQHALGIARGARCVAHRGRGIFVEGLPLEIAVGLRDPVFIGDRVLQRGLWHMRLVGEHDVAFDAWQLVGDFFQHRHKGDIGHHHTVLRMVDDPGDLIGEQSRIDGMADRTDAHDAVPGFEMAPRVPRDGGDAVAELDAVTIEALRDLQARSRISA